jgi:CBS domain-containing protein
MISEGELPVNTVALSELSSIERSRLKDSLRHVRDWQDKAAYHYRTGLY